MWLAEGLLLSVRVSERLGEAESTGVGGRGGEDGHGWGRGLMLSPPDLARDLDAQGPPACSPP